MSQETAIEWTDLSWNPVHGCSKVSPGCAHCYAETLSLRYRQTIAPWTPANAAQNVILKPHKLREPLSGGKVWRGLGDAARAAGKDDGMLVFVNSTSDLFHEEVPVEYVWQVLDVMREAERHTFQVLTKRPERMRQIVNAWYALRSPLGDEPPVPNVWLGVSIENRRFVGRADVLREAHAAVRFVSAEPLLGPLFRNSGLCRECGESPVEPCMVGECDLGGWGDDFDGLELDLRGIDWLIVGGESGPGHRRLDLEWVRDLRDACCAAGTALFVKQLGGVRPGTRLEYLPEDLRIREFPALVKYGSAVSATPTSLF